MEKVARSEQVRSLSLPAYAMSIDEIHSELGTDLIDGLNDQEVNSKLEMYGPNVLPTHKRSIWQLYFAPLVEWLIVAYLVMTGVLIVLTFWDPSNATTAGIWLIVVMINFAIAIFQQFRAQKKIDALQRLSAVEAKVFRNGIWTTVPNEELVPGDIIEIAQGNRIPADSRIINSNNLLVNEASLTGESVPVSKADDGHATILDKDTQMAERINMLFSGTFVEFGSGRAVVCNTGRRTEIGKISTDLDELNTGEIPLRNKVNKLGKILTISMVIFLTITMTINLARIMDVIATGNITALAKTLSSSVITAMSIMPINIPLLTTIVLITGVLSMATYGVVIRNLSAVESLGRASILCSDKTGTITRSQMTVKRIWDCQGHLYGVTGIGYGSSGAILPLRDEVTAEIPEQFALVEMNLIRKDSALELILVSGFLNNDAELIIEDFVEEKKRQDAQVSWRATGSATDAALLALFKKSGINEKHVQEKYQLEREYPFDSKIKRMSKVFKSDNPGYYVFTKGATEVLLPLCTRIGIPGDEQEFTDEKKSKIHEKINNFAALGFRVLMFTFKGVKQLPPKKAKDERETIESDLTFLGFVCVLDPPREGVKESVSECLSAGVQPIMITGDSPVTGAAIAREVGLLREGQSVHQGKEIEGLDMEEFDRTTVFARVSPQHKQIIIERYQGQDRVVGMTGDGVNDALALSMADAGIAMGITGTDVSKQAADLIITDDSFNSIVTGIRQGRGLFQKIRIMIFFYICVNLAEATIYFITSLLPLPYPFLEIWQRMYIFGLVHSLPPIAIIFDRLNREIMDRDPIDSEGIFNRRLFTALLVTAIPFSVMMFIVYFLPYSGLLVPVNDFNLTGSFTLKNYGIVTASDAQLKARTMFITLVYIVESLVVMNIRRIDKNVIEGNFSKENRFWLTYICVAPLPIFHVCAMYLPFIQEFIYWFTLDILPLGGANVELIMLDPLDWVVILIAAAVPLTSLESYKAYTRRQGKFF
ncbi:MAG: cation-translocating P-type ATPase [Candidatus Hodarchaeales archaeon]|jgi:Ca2+-transporting ATPase